MPYFLWANLETDLVFMNEPDSHTDMTGTAKQLVGDQRDERTPPLASACRT